MYGFVHLSQKEYRMHLNHIPFEIVYLCEDKRFVFNLIKIKNVRKNI